MRSPVGEYVSPYGQPALSIEGEVGRPIELQPPELAALADTEVVADFHCHEGWSRLGVRWRGVRLATLLSLVGASEDGHYVTVASGGFTAVLSREQAEDGRVLLDPTPSHDHPIVR